MPVLDELMQDCGFERLACRWYRSVVRLTDWQREKQISRLQAKTLYSEVVRSAERYRLAVELRINEGRRNILFRFPVVVASYGRKT